MKCAICSTAFHLQSASQGVDLKKDAICIAHSSLSAVIQKSLLSQIGLSAGFGFQPAPTELRL